MISKQSGVDGEIHTAKGVQSIVSDLFITFNNKYIQVVY